LPAPFLKIRSTWELEANALEKAALGSHTDSFVLPVFTKVRPAVAFSLQEFGSEVIVLSDLEPNCHDMGPIFDYLTHGAAVGFTKGCPVVNWPSP